jgi:hypothetical protein
LLAGLATPKPWINQLDPNTRGTRTRARARTRH